jgi:hypothetical protein
MSKSASVSLSDYCSFDHVYNNVVTPFLTSLDDQRAFNQSYGLADCLKAAFSIFSLKAPSMYQFRQMAQAEEHNLHTIYGVGSIPEDTAFREVLDGVDPACLREGFVRLFGHFSARTDLACRYHAWRDFTVVSVDGVEHFCSKKVSCPHCLTRNHRDGSTTNYHSMLSAAIVHPDRAEVFPLDHEPIVKADGAIKNDCERNAIHRLLENFQRAYSQLNTIFVLDALYACAPVITKLNQTDNWRYVISTKEVGNKHLFTQFDERNEVGKVKWLVQKDDQGRQWEIGYANGLELNASSADIKVNLVFARSTDKRGKEVVYSFLTDIKLTKKNVVRILSIGRSRWKIENETFNTLKNQGYQFKHNYGHGKKNLCTIMAYSMMMAFWVDQLQQAANQPFQKLVAGLKTRVKLWDAMRAVVKILPVDNMKQLFLQVAEMYCVRLI